MVNKRRGEIPITIGDTDYVMCMDLGAMAEIEEGLDIDSSSDLATYFDSRKVKVRDLIVLLGALLRGGGHDITDDEIKRFDLAIVESFGTAMEAITAQGGDKPAPKKKRVARRSAGKR